MGAERQPQWRTEILNFCQTIFMLYPAALNYQTRKEFGVVARISLQRNYLSTKRHQRDHSVALMSFRAVDAVNWWQPKDS